MPNSLTALIKRALGWSLVITLTFIIIVGVAAAPYLLLPGNITFHFLSNDAPFAVFMIWVVGVMSWRLAPFNQPAPLSVDRARRFLWACATATALALWPPLLLAWINCWHPAQAAPTIW